VEQGTAEDPRDVLSLARVLERAQDHERSEATYQRALDAAAPGVDDDVRRASLARLAARAKRAGDVGTALAFWEQAVAAGELAAYRELAVLQEHHCRDLVSALAVVEQGLARLAGACGAPAHLARDLHHRRERLRHRLERGRRAAGEDLSDQPPHA
jgi:hypothetical protein